MRGNPNKEKPMGLEDLISGAEGALNNEQVQGALHSAQAEQISDGILDKAGDFAEGLTGHKFDGAIEQGKSFADGAVGNE